MSSEQGATVQTQYTSTQMLSDHWDKSVTEEQAPAKLQDTCASFQTFHAAGLDLLTGTAGNRSPQELRQAQLSDQDLKPVLDWMERSSHRPPWEEIAPRSGNTKVYSAQWQSLQLFNGVLCRLWETPSGDATVKQLILPKSHRTEVLQQLHDTQMAGHLGVAKTLSHVRERFYWFQCQ